MFWRVRPAPSAMAHYGEFAHHGPTESPGPKPMTKTVLIVEDNDLNIKLFHDLLEAQGYKTLHTRTGQEALALATDLGMQPLVVRCHLGLGRLGHRTGSPDGDAHLLTARVPLIPRSWP